MKLLGRLAGGTEAVPTGVGRRRTITRAGIEVGTAPWAEALAILTALEEPGRRQQPLLTDRMPEIQLVRSGIDHVHIRVVHLIPRLFGEDDVSLVAHRGLRIGEATTARARDLAADPRVPVEPARTSRREAARYVDAFEGQRVSLLPHGIGSGKVGIDRHGLLTKRPDVIGQHSQEIY